ncbi:hypothetical protein GCM10022419_009280 [Nonomuraea rosea]|uniref:Uncharacterized protein n=1 Tax=Nonomuraea rosea TaxID=638574 RepID=A0ABP6VG21_9ACTN
MQKRFSSETSGLVITAPAGSRAGIAGRSAIVASTPARDLPLLTGELRDLLTGWVCGEGADDCPDDGADACAGGGEPAAVPHRSQ